MSTTAKEYSSLLVEEETAPLQSKSNSRKVVLGAIGLGAMGLLAGGAMGGYFASNSQQEETSSNEPDWVRSMTKTKWRSSKDSRDGNDDGACPSADDYFCTYIVDDINQPLVSTAGEKEEDIKATGSGYGSCGGTGANGAAYARCTEHCCTTYGADLSYNKDIIANYGRTVCQAGCIQTLDDGCITLSVSQQSAAESKKSFFHAMLDPTVKGYTSSEQVSAQGSGYGYDGKFSCPEVICQEEKKARQGNCEYYCGWEEFLGEGAAVVSGREAFLFSGDGKKKSKKSTGSPAPEWAYTHRYRVLFDSYPEVAYPRIDFELEFDPWGEDVDIFETENEGGLIFNAEFLEEGGEELFHVCVDGCMKGCDYYEEVVRKTYGGYN